MKSIIPLLAVPVLAAVALVGCNQNSPDTSTGSPATNSSMNGAISTPGGFVNAPATNNLPAMATNQPAGTNK